MINKLQGWELNDSITTPTNQLRILSDSLNYEIKAPIHRKSIKSTSPTKQRILKCYVRDVKVLSQKQHLFQGTYSQKAQFSPKKLHKHSYIGPLLQQIQLYQKHQNHRLLTK